MFCETLCDSLKYAYKTYFEGSQSMLCESSKYVCFVKLFLRDIKYVLQKLKVCFVNPQSMFCETYLRNKESNSNDTAALLGTK